MTIIKNLVIFALILIPTASIVIVALFYAMVLKINNFVFGRKKSSDNNERHADWHVYEIKN